MKKTILIILLGALFIPSLVFSHSGDTDIYGCHYCWTNCASEGLYYSEYHCHNTDKNDVCDPYVWWDIESYNWGIESLKSFKKYTEELYDSCLSRITDSYNDCIDRQLASFPDGQRDCGDETTALDGICKMNKDAYNRGIGECETYRNGGVIDCSLAWSSDISRYDFCIQNTYYDDFYVKYLAELEKQAQQTCDDIYIDKMTLYTDNNDYYYDSKCEVLRDKNLENEIINVYSDKCRTDNPNSYIFYNIKIGNHQKDNIVSWCKPEPEQPEVKSEPEQVKPEPRVIPLLQPSQQQEVIIDKDTKDDVDDYTENTSTTNIINENNDKIIDTDLDEDSSKSIIQVVKDVIVNFFKKIYEYFK